MDIVALNERMFTEFRRTTGSTSHHEFALWCAAQVRAVIALEDDVDRMRASAKWAALTRRQQQDRLLAYLTSMPSAETTNSRTPSWLKAMISTRVH